MTYNEYLKIKEIEGDEFYFNHLGCFCFGLRNSMGAWCGYVVIKHSLTESINPFDDCDDTILNMIAHGGITYSGIINENGSLLNKLSVVPNIPNGSIIIGFDCAHYRDYVPELDKKGFMSDMSEKEYRNKNYVMEECKQIAYQINNEVDGANYVHKIFKKLNGINSNDR